MGIRGTQDLYGTDGNGISAHYSREGGQCHTAGIDTEIHSYQWRTAGLELCRVGTSNTDWSTIRDTAMHYVEGKKAQHRFDGKGNFDLSKVATWDMLERKGLVP